MYFQFQSRAAYRDYYAADKALKSNENIGMDEYMRRHSSKSLYFQEKRKQRYGVYKGKEVREDSRRRIDFERIVNAVLSFARQNKEMVDDDTLSF